MIKDAIEKIKSFFKKLFRSKRQSTKVSARLLLPIEYELFQDSSYYDMWCVRSIHDTRFNSPKSFHFISKEMAENFKQLIEVAK